MREDAEPLLRARRGRSSASVDAVVLLGHGRLLARARGAAALRSRAERFHVLDTTHPRAIRALEAQPRPRADALHRLLEVGRRRSRRARTPTTSGSSRRAGAQWAAITDPGSELERLGARARLRRGGRRASRRSAGATRRSRRSGSLPAALVGADLERPARPRLRDGRGLPPRARATPASSSGLALGEGWREGRDKICVPDGGRLRALGRAAPGRVDRQAGQGARPRARASRREGPDRQTHELRLAGPLRARRRSSSAGSSRPRSPARSSGSTPSTSPTSRRRRTGRTRCWPRGDVDARAGVARPRSSSPSAAPGDYVCIQAFVEPTPAADARIARAGRRAPGERTGCVVTHGYGPRYLHSTGQLHKGGPNSGLFLQVVEDYGRRAADPRPPLRLRAADPRPGGRRLRLARASAAAASPASSSRSVA